MEGQLEFREYESRYQKAVLELHELALKQSKYAKDSWDPTWDEDLGRIEETYLKNNGAFLLLLSGEKLVGMGALLKVDEDTAKVKRMRVRAAYQKKGLSKLIIAELEKKARQLGYKKLIADTAKGNLPAEKMLLKAGFKPTEDVYFGKVLCTLFEKRLE